MSEANPKPDTEPLTTPNQPATNPFHDPADLAKSEDANRAQPKVQLSEMTTHVIDDIPGTPPSAAPDDSATQQHPGDPMRTTNISPPSVLSPTTQVIVPVDARIAGLVAIFPSFDHDLLRDVLNECNNDEEQAVDILLGMSDPNHVPSTTVTNTQGQTDLDAQLAQRLMLEEQEAAAREYDSQGRGPRGQQQQLPYTPRQNPRRRSSEIPPDVSLQEQFHDFIAPRRDRPQQPSGPSGGAGGGINTAELQEQFNKMADTGKKTFNNFVTKMRARLAPVDSVQSNDQSYVSPEHQTGATWNQHQPAPSEWPIQPAPSGSAPTKPSGGYDIPQEPAPTASLNLPPANPDRPTSPPAAAGVDRSKLGLLPKRPVSMTSPRASTEIPEDSRPKPANDDQEDDDDLYAMPVTTTQERT